MHFWIDKRSQGCGFGRARVAASLSNSGGAGLGFGHYPPSRRNKSMLMSAPIHRLQSQDFARPTYLIHQQHQQQNSNTNCNNNNNSNNNNNNNNNNNDNNNSNNNNNRSGGSSHNNSNRNSNRNNNQNNSYREYQQYHNNLPCYQSSIQQNNASQYILQNYEIPPHRNNQFNLNIPSNCNEIINNNNTAGSARTINITNANNSPNNYHNVPLPHIYGGSSQPQQQSAGSNDLEQGTIGSINITRQHHLQSDTEQHQHILNSNGQYNIIENRETQQLLPSHLKCGIWASLIVASVCLAGSKFYYDPQGNGVEIFIFFTFLAIFFWAACTVSLCQCPKKLITSTNRSSTSIINNSHHHHNVDIDNNDNLNNSISIRNHSLQNHHNQIFIDNNTEQLNQDIELLSAATAAPPPYHIAILLPDTNKELVEFDETPPPSYDKVLI